MKAINFFPKPLGYYPTPLQLQLTRNCRAQYMMGRPEPDDTNKGSQQDVRSDPDCNLLQLCSVRSVASKRANNLIAQTASSTPAAKLRNEEDSGDQLLG